MHIDPNTGRLIVTAVSDSLLRAVALTGYAVATALAGASVLTAVFA